MSIVPNLDLDEPDRSPTKAMAAPVSTVEPVPISEPILPAYEDRSRPLPTSEPVHLPVLDTDSLRRELAGLADPLPRTPGATEHREIRETAIRLCSILAYLFGEALERTTLWDRIGTAFATASATMSDDDLDRYVTLCLEHVQADPGQTAACEAVRQLLETFAARPQEWRFAMLDYLNSHRFAVLVHGRARWEQVKNKEIEL